MLQSSLGQLPEPFLSDLPGLNVRDIMLRLIYGTSGDALSLCHGEDAVTGNLIAAGQHLPDQLLCLCGFGFLCNAVKQFIRGNLTLAVQPAEAIPQVERKGLPFRR